MLLVKRQAMPSLREASFAHTDAVWGAGELNNGVLESVKRASYRVKSDVMNVAGVQLPLFQKSANEHDQVCTV